MIPRDGCPQVMPLDNLTEVRRTLLEGRVSREGAEIMSKKALFRVIRVRGLDVRAANILKQEMLARGGEVAISREVFELEGKAADCLIMGTVGQFERLLPKLSLQPFRLPALAISLAAALDNYDLSVPRGPAGLDLSLGPLIMGILNVTPDSFSDGGHFPDRQAAIEHGLTMIAEGAALIDIGGESTRPGALPISADVELRRVLPIVRELGKSLPGRVSVDTSKARVAAECLNEGAYMVNDVSGLRADPEMVAVVRDADCPVVLMHMRGCPADMQEDPHYESVVEDVYGFFVDRLNWAVDAGLREENLLIDPGLGFGKTTIHNLELMRNLCTFRSLGRPILVGASRKNFLGEILGIGRPAERDLASAFATTLAVRAGAHVVRVHEIRQNRAALRLAGAVAGLGEWKDRAHDTGEDGMPWIS